MIGCGKCKGYPGCDKGCNKEVTSGMTRNEAAVIDAARSYAALGKTIDLETPQPLIENAKHRREMLFRAVDRLEANGDA